MSDKIKNDGVAPGPQRNPTAYIAGTLPYEIRRPDGDWTNFCPPGEFQSKNHVDSMACVTYSILNAIEMQEFFLTGKQVNYSDRWIAKMSGTTSQGNWLYKVADTIRQYGLVLEEDYPSDFDSFADYYADIPQPLMDQLLAKGKRWLEKNNLAYEFLGTDLTELQKQLKHVPLQVVIPGHAIVEIRNLNDLMRYFDSYDPYQKQTAQNAISDALKPLLTKKGIHMEILQVVGEQTLVVRNGEGKYFDIATSPDLYPLVARILGLAQGAQPGTVSRADVNANYAGQAKPVLAFIEK